MWTLHNLNRWQRLHRHVMTIESGSDTGGSDNTGANDGNAEGKPDNAPESQDETSKEFSRALAKRKAELEKQYADRLKDYDELKKKAAAYDEQRESGKSDMDRLSERLVAIESERDRLAAEQKRATTVKTVAKATGVPADAIALLSGDDEESLTAAAKALADLMGKPADRRKAPPAARGDNNAPRAELTGMDLLRDAYSN